MKNRAVEPDDVFDVALDFGDVLAQKNAHLVRLEVAVCDGVAVIVSPPSPWTCCGASADASSFATGAIVGL